MNTRVVKLIKTHGVLNPFSGHYELSTCYVNEDNVACDFGGTPLSAVDARDIIDTYA